VVTVTETGPAGRAGVVNVSEVGLFTVTSAAGMVTPPMVTLVSPGWNPVPVMLTVVPPVVGPCGGVKPEAVGATAGGRLQVALPAVRVPRSTLTGTPAAVPVRVNVMLSAVALAVGAVTCSMRVRTLACSLALGTPRTATLAVRMVVALT